MEVSVGGKQASGEACHRTFCEEAARLCCPTKPRHAPYPSPPPQKGKNGSSCRARWPCPADTPLAFLVLLSSLTSAKSCVVVKAIGLEQ